GGGEGGDRGDGGRVRIGRGDGLRRQAVVVRVEARGRAQVDRVRHVAIHDAVGLAGYRHGLRLVPVGGRKGQLRRGHRPFGRVRAADRDRHATGRLGGQSHGEAGGKAVLGRLQVP